MCAVIRYLWKVRCAMLDARGYEGHVGLEYKPSTPVTEQSFAGWGEAHGIA